MSEASAEDQELALGKLCLLYSIYFWGCMILRVSFMLFCLFQHLFPLFWWFYFSLLYAYMLALKNVKQSSIFYHSTFCFFALYLEQILSSICYMNAILISKTLVCTHAALFCTLIFLFSFFFLGHILANVKRCIVFLLVISILNSGLTHCDALVKIYQAG